MPTPTNFEQEMLELMNRARQAPSDEFDVFISDAASQTGTSANITNALRFFNVDANAFATQMSGYAAVAPLAWNLALSTAAQGHSALMITQDEQSHQLTGEPGLSARIVNAGYTNWSGVSENIYAFTRDPLHGHAGFMIDWGYDAEDYDPTALVPTLFNDWASRGDGMQDPPGHRNTIMSSSYTEVGIAAIEETDAGTSVGPQVVTQNFANRFDYAAQLLGVVLQDGDGDRFYDAGEGLGGITVTAVGTPGTFSTTTWSSGGYQMELAPGAYTVTFSGGGLTGTVQQAITMGASNQKLDAFAADATLGADAGDNTLTGTSGDDLIDGLGGNDNISTGAGNDTLIGNTGADWLTPGAGSDSVDGGDGTDMVSFVDLGAGVSVNLATGAAVSGADTDTLSGIENVTGSIYVDVIQGDAGDNRLRGLGHYDWFIGSDGADTIEGGNGRDMISYVYASAGVTVNLGTGQGLAGQAAGDSYDSIERVTGSVHADLLHGSSGADDFRGLGGYDWFVGSGGGKDRYDGGGGRDTVTYSASAAGVSASLLLGRGSTGDAARDLYTAIENLTGSIHADSLTGDHGRNILRGLYGEDTIFGNGGTDYITGGASDDFIDGGGGWDVAVFSGARAAYTVTPGTSGVTVRHDSGNEGTDSLFDIEALLFADGLVYF